mmetsp:Transcript_22264/g.71678  ORF Transcript_22264/g.71678 Transcript_22264/m.71678 type:complete len:239 (-) Transcript_22264:341-1057(-)
MRMHDACVCAYRARSGPLNSQGGWGRLARRSGGDVDGERVLAGTVIARERQNVARWMPLHALRSPSEGNSGHRISGSDIRHINMLAIHTHGNHASTVAEAHGSCCMVGSIDSTAAHHVFRRPQAHKRVCGRYREHLARSLHVDAETGRSVSLDRVTMIQGVADERVQLQCAIAITTGCHGQRGATREEGHLVDLKLMRIGLKQLALAHINHRHGVGLVTDDQIGTCRVPAEEQILAGR